MPAKRSALALAGLLVLAVLLAGCGGGGDSARGSVTQSGRVAPPKAETQGQRSPAPLRVSGGGSAQFEVKGGDNSVQEYGSEGSESELREAAEVVHSFYVARTAEQWQRACAFLAKRTIEGFLQLAAKAPQFEGKGCAPMLAALTEPLSPSQQRAATTVDAHALRQEGSQGFLIYTGPPGQTVYSMPLDLEGGEWKLGAISSSALPGVD